MFLQPLFRRVFLAASICSTSGLMAQTTLTLSGTVRNARNGESLIGATVRVTGSAAGTVSNEYGFYSLSLFPGTHLLEVSAAGMKADTLRLVLVWDTTITFRLHEAGSLQNVTVSAASRNGRSVQGAQMGVERLRVEDVKNLPILLGERDVLKSIQLLPGIKSAGDGNAGFYVRGGSADQNQILLDEANVYNATHLLGFFSTFNSDALKDITVYKGGMPAQYGGRLSSVLDIKMNDGDNQAFHASGAIGLISAKVNVEGPIHKGQSSFLFTGRRTYADLFLRASPDTTVSRSQLYFYDLNAKLNYELGPKDRLYLSGYFGKDRLGFGDQFGLDWGNGTGTLRWNHVFGPRLFANTSLIYSNYNYEIEIRSGANDFRIFSQIRDWNLKQDYQWNLGRKQTARFGWSSTYHTVRPGEISASQTSSINARQQQQRYSLENAAYFSNTWKASSRLTLTYGMRLTAFSMLGKGDFYTLNQDGAVIDNTRYRSGEIVKTYWNPEPRIALGYLLSNTASVKASYVRNVQNMHLISNSTSATPTDKWVSSSNNIRPELSDQVSLGYYRNLAGWGIRVDSRSLLQKPAATDRLPRRRGCFQYRSARNAIALRTRSRLWYRADVAPQNGPPYRMA